MQILNWNHVLLLGVLHASYGVWSRYVSNISRVVKHHLILYNSIKDWHYITKYLGRNNIKSLLSFIVQNADFPAGTDSSAFSLLWDGGFVHLETCLEIMCPKEQFFGYLKVRHFLSSNLTSTSINLPTCLQGSVTYL